MRFDTLQAWLDWQESLNPAGIELGLERVGAVFRRLDAPPPAPLVVTVAGTNGKGSSVALLEAILLAAGYGVGAYTSPHLFRYNERVRVVGEPVTDSALCEAFQRVDSARGEIALTYFEFGTLAALDIFARANLDVAILEVGLGGRLDAVNILDADVALITALDVDHRDWLGSDRETIAGEKAGILRPGRPAVCSDPDAPRTLREHAAALGAPLHLLDGDYGFEPQGGHWNWFSATDRREALPWPALRGPHQLQNAAGVLMVLKLLQDRLPVGQNEVRRGLLSAQVPGRYQVLPGEVTRILDVAHNPSGARALARTLASHGCPGRTHAVVGMLADKDIDATLRELQGQVQLWHLASLDVPRGATAARLAAALHAMGETGPVYVYDSPVDAGHGALSQARPGDRVVIFGSFYTVAALGAPDL